MVAEEGMVICVGPGRADRLAPRRLTGTGNVLTSRLCHEKCHAGLITVTLLQGCRSSMQQMLIRARHSSYWDARYVRCKALRRTFHCTATPGAKDEQRAARGLNFISSRERSPGSRVSIAVTMSRRHGVTCHTYNEHPHN